MTLLRNVVPALLVLTAAACSDPGSLRTPVAPAGLTQQAPSANSAGALARVQGKRLSNLSVTTTFNSLDAEGMPADITNDGRGVYADGIDAVVSILTQNGYNGIAYGDWQLDTTSSSSRAVGESLDADDAVQPGDPHYTAPANPPFWGTQSLRAKVEVKCTFLSRSMLTMTAGASMTCPLVNNFTAMNGVAYSLGPAASFSGLPEITDVQVDCLAADSTGCNSWNIRPIGSSPAVARLVQHSGKPNGSDINDGDFYLRFLIHITRP